MASPSAGGSSNSKRVLKGAASKKFSKQGSKLEPEVDFTGLSSFVAKPAVRRKIYSEARSLLGDAKTESKEELLNPQALFKQAAASVRKSVRTASLTGFSISQLTGTGSTVAESSTAEIPPERRLSCGSFASETHSAEDGKDVEEEEEGSEAERLRQQFLKSLEEVKQILQRLDLSETVEEVSTVLGRVKDLEAMIKAAGRADLEGDEERAGALKDVEERVQLALETATNKIPTAVEAISRCKSPRTSQLATKALGSIAGFKEQSQVLGVPLLAKKAKGRKKKEQAMDRERRFSREELRQKLRSNAFQGWTPLPPPLQPQSPKKRDVRSRESWLQWWSHDEGDGLDRRDEFFESLPPHKLTLMEMELRDAIIDFLEQRKGKESPTWDEIRVQPMVVQCAKNLLPHFVTLEEWLHRRQRLSNQGVVTWPPPPPVWRLQPVERWKKDPRVEPVPVDNQMKFQRRDSTQRRSSSVFGVNFEVTEHGQIFGALAGDDEALRELPWPCSSVVPEQKNFRWIQQGARGSLPAVDSPNSPNRNMTVEDVMAWRLSHRFRRRRVEPVLESMWQALSRQRSAKACKCEHCNGTLQYEITLASS